MPVSNRNSSFLDSYELLLKHLQYKMLVHWSIYKTDTWASEGRDEHSMVQIPPWPKEALYFYQAD
jgi:hypothetical protein